MKNQQGEAFPIGTVRGPYICGKGNDPAGGIQYLTKGPGGWVPFIESRGDEKECKRRAYEYAATLTGKVE